MERDENLEISERYKEDFINKLRIFRNEKNISAREMSLALGQNVNYINFIENGKRLPSMQGFFAICEYFNIPPADFFNNSVQNNIDKSELLTNYQKLKTEEANHIMLVIKDLIKNK